MPTMTEAKLAIVDTLKANSAVATEFTTANIDYGEPRNLNLETVVKRINVVSVGRVEEQQTVLSGRRSTVRYDFDVVASFLDTDPKSASDRWERYEAMMKDALEGNPFLLRGGVKHANIGISFPRSLVVNNPQVDSLYHVVVSLEARHSLVASSRAA